MSDDEYVDDFEPVQEGQTPKFIRKENSLDVRESIDKAVAKVNKITQSSIDTNKSKQGKHSIDESDVPYMKYSIG